MLYKGINIKLAALSRFFLLSLKHSTNKGNRNISLSIKFRKEFRSSNRSRQPTICKSSLECRKTCRVQVQQHSEM